MMAAGSLSPKTSFIVALTIASVAVAYAAHVQAGIPGGLDFDQLYMAAKFLAARRDPYTLIGPGREFQWAFVHFLYPLTSAAAIIPLTVFPLWMARLVFAGLTAALYVYALGRQPGSRWRYVTVLSKPFQAALIMGQSSLWLASMVMLPAAGLLAAIKPNIAAAVIAAKPSYRAIGFAVTGGSVLLAISLALQPHWPLEWLGMVRDDPYRWTALERPGGLLLVLSVLRWRRPEARLLLALSIVPQTLGMYDALVLFAIPRRASQFIALVALSHFAFLMVFFDAGLSTIDARVAASATAVVQFLYLPTLAIVLWRPNEGDVPAWLERLALRAPTWLRGRVQEPVA